MFKCINCAWKGEEPSKKPLPGKCPACGDEVEGKEEAKKATPKVAPKPAEPKK